MSKLFTFTLSDGSIKVLTIQDARALNLPEVDKRIEQIHDNLKNKRMIKDGFEPGFQENIGTYCGGRREYDAALRERGLVEIGKDYVPNGERNEISPCANEDFVQECLNQGVDLTGEEQSAIVSGEFFKEGANE